MTQSNETESTTTQNGTAAEDGGQSQSLATATDSSNSASAPKHGAKRSHSSSNVRSIKGGAPEKPLNIVAHEWLNRLMGGNFGSKLLSVYDHVIRTLGGTTLPRGEKRQAGDLRAAINMDEQVINVFAAPPFSGAKSATGIKTFEVIPPTFTAGGLSLVVIRDGRHEVKTARPKEGEPLRANMVTIGKGGAAEHHISRRPNEWRINVNVQRFTSPADRERNARVDGDSDLSVKGGRKAEDVIDDLVMALCHIRAANVGRSGLFKAFLKALGVNIGSGDTPTTYSDAYKAWRADLAREVGKVPEGLLIDYTAYLSAPPAQATYVVWTCPKTVKAELPVKDPETGKKTGKTALQDAPCPIGKLRIGGGAVVEAEKLLPKGQHLTVFCPLHNKVKMIREEADSKTQTDTTPRLGTAAAQ